MRSTLARLTLALPVVVMGCSHGSASKPPEAPPPPMVEMSKPTIKPTAEPKVDPVTPLDAMEQPSEPTPVADKLATLPNPTTKTVQLIGRSGSKMVGQVVLIERDTGVEVHVTVKNAAPGSHGIHVHEVADCSAKDGKSAGDHWNPGKNVHGMPGDADHHLGDLGNLEVKADGTGELTLLVPSTGLDDGAHSLLGHAIVIHAGTDDGKTQPSGGSGDRIGCAEIK